MRARAFAFGLLIVWVTAAEIAAAECVCRCVNGVAQPLCRSTMDLPPICSPQVCPIVPPSIAPIPAPRIPPIGTKECRQEQVYNPATKQYEWKSVCK